MKEDLNEWKNTPCLWVRKLDIFKMEILLSRAFHII